jgi:hypothetical protein
MLGDVGEPQPIRPLDAELPVDQVLAGPTGRVTHRAATASPPVEALDAHGAHQPGDPLAVHRPSEPEAQLDMHPSPAVDALGLGVNLFNLL